MRTLTQALLCAVGLLAAGAAHSEDQAVPVVLINPFVVPADKLDESLALWEQARDFLQREPGYISTILHQSVSGDAQYRLINVAQWESAESFHAATARMRETANLPRIEGVSFEPALYTVVRRD